MMQNCRVSRVVGVMEERQDRQNLGDAERKTVEFSFVNNRKVMNCVSESVSVRKFLRQKKKSGKKKITNKIAFYKL